MRNTQKILTRTFNYTFETLYLNFDFILEAFLALEYDFLVNKRLKTVSLLNIITSIFQRRTFIVHNAAIKLNQSAILLL